jgi:hypothetical protein
VSTPIQTVENTVAAKLREIEGLKVYEVRPPGALPLPCATLTLISANMHGGFPVTMQHLTVTMQVDVWSRTQDQMRDFADKVIMKLFEDRTEMSFTDIVLKGAMDRPEEKIWHRNLYYQIETTVKKSE